VADVGRGEGGRRAGLKMLAESSEPRGGHVGTLKTGQAVGQAVGVGRHLLEVTRMVRLASHKRLTGKGTRDPDGVPDRLV
jgi:hypothetical protein